ncbi:hypothetical protein L523_0058 [Bordetella bronchiseptica MBORD731]|nr:hypothetical protein L523_0058 [Bordetella bronchiseptica MBORD731]
MLGDHGWLVGVGPRAGGPNNALFETGISPGRAARRACAARRKPWFGAIIRGNGRVMHALVAAPRSGAGHAPCVDRVSDTNQHTD